jgi:hypothetical protein
MNIKVVLLTFTSLLFFNVTAIKAQQDSTSLLSIKLIESNKDTLVGADFMVRYPNFPGESYQFNGYKLNNKEKLGDSLIIWNDTIKVVLIEEPFDSSTKKMTYFENKPGSMHNQLRLVNDKQYYGTDGPIPRKQIKEITVEINGVKKSLAPSQYADLFEAQFLKRVTTVVLLTDGRIIIYYWGSDGAGGYYAIFIMKDGIVKQRIAGLGF